MVKIFSLLLDCVWFEGMLIKGLNFTINQLYNLMQKFNVMENLGLGYKMQEEYQLIAGVFRHRGGD